MGCLLAPAWHLTVERARSRRQPVWGWALGRGRARGVKVSVPVHLPGTANALLLMA